MIRLIACDVDGTLLQSGSRQISIGIFHEINRLMQKGVIFCPASGRQYQSLRKLFAPVAQNVPYLCENGGIVYGAGDPGPILAKTVMEREKAMELCYQIMEIPECEILISGANTSYLCAKSPLFLVHMRDFTGNNVQLLQKVEDVPEEIIKVSVFCKSGAAALVPLFAQRWGEFYPSIAGYNWLDFTSANKGIGLQQLLHCLRISTDEVMAFGDNYNDLSMLNIVKYPYIMDTAAETLKVQVSCHCHSVETVLRTL